MKNSMTSKISIVAFLLVGACSLPRSTDYRVPGFINETVESHTLALDDGSNKKTGTACTKNLAGFYTNGDSSIATAAKNGGITKVNYVDKKIFSVGTFYAEVCTIVRGH